MLELEPYIDSTLCLAAEAKHFAIFLIFVVSFCVSKLCVAATLLPEWSILVYTILVLVEFSTVKIFNNCIRNLRFNSHSRLVLGLSHIGNHLGPLIREMPSNFGAKIKRYIFFKFFYF